MKEITRRQFLKWTGKGLAAAVLAGSGVAPVLPKAKAEDEILSVNSLVKGEKEMRVVFLERLSTKKSDAFYITSMDENGMDLYLVDGGLATGKCMLELVNLRKEILKNAGLESEYKNPNYKLDIHLLISHFHTDHVRELTSSVIGHKYLRILSACYPAATALDQSGVYENDNNADLDNRPALFSELSRRWPQAEKYEMAFGEKRFLPLRTGELQLFAANEDWGLPEAAAYAEQIYYPTDMAARRADMPTAIVNSNCLWMRFVFGGHSVLFTGDVMKKKTDAADEPLDRMVTYYGADALRSDIVKYPHHGLSRDPAAKPVRESLITDHPLACCILTGSKAGEKAGKVLDVQGVKWQEIDKGTIVYSLKETGMEQIG